MGSDTTVTGNIYEVTIEGQYYGFRAGQKSIGNYEITVKMDEQAKAMGFLSVARNKILPRALKAKYPDYKRFRTHQITEVKNLSQHGQPVRELALMNRKQIVAYVLKKNLPIDVDLYPEVSDLRQAVTSFRENRDLFLKIQEKRKGSKGPELKMMRALDELNPDIDKPQYTQEEADKIAIDPMFATIHTPLNSEKYAAAKSQDTMDEPDDYDDSISISDDYTTPSIPEFDDQDELSDMLNGI